MMRKAYAKALYQDPDATPDDLRERAVTTLEDAGRTRAAGARRRVPARKGDEASCEKREPRPRPRRGTARAT